MEHLLCCAFADGKERRYIVVSMTSRAEAIEAAAAIRLRTRKLVLPGELVCRASAKATPP